jgi:hypothetical protein
MDSVASGLVRALQRRDRDVDSDYQSDESANESGSDVEMADAATGDLADFDKLSALDKGSYISQTIMHALDGMQDANEAIDLQVAGLRMISMCKEAHFARYPLHEDTFPKVGSTTKTDRLRGRTACQGFCTIAESIEDELTKLNLYYYALHTDELGWKAFDLANVQSRKRDTDLDNKKLTMENHSLKTQIEELSQRVEDLQLHVSNSDATKKKDVRFSDDSTSSAQQLLQNALPSMSASDLHKLQYDILREFGKFLPSVQTPSAAPGGDVQPSSSTMNDVQMTMDSASPTSAQTLNDSPPVRESDQPGTTTKTPGYMKGTAAADARHRARPGSAADDLVKRPNTRTLGRPTTPKPKTSGRPAPGTREEVHTGDRRRIGHTTTRDSPPSPSAIAANTPKKGKSAPETGGQGKAAGSSRPTATGGSIRRRGPAGRR